MDGGWQVAEAGRAGLAAKVRLAGLVAVAERAGLAVEAQWVLLQEPDLGEPES